MAIEKQIVDPTSNDDVPEAYHRIVGLSIDYLGKNAQLHVWTWRNQQCRLDGLHPIARRSVICTEDGTPSFDAVMAAAAEPVQSLGNFLYTFLKSLSDWHGGKDV